MAKIRLDKYIASALIISRKDAAALIKKGRITVNGLVEKSSDAKIEDGSTVVFDGERLVYSEHLYFMLNKPKGLVCASEDRRENTVISLFPKEYADKGISCVGRLDKDTVGLLLVTNDGALSHRLLSPKSETPKKYLVRTDKPFDVADIETMRRGIVIEGKNTAPAALEICAENPFEATITVTEGKFHEVKRLCYACGEKEVVFLKRLEFGALRLDESLAEGEWRALTDEEIKMMKESI